MDQNDAMWRSKLTPEQYYVTRQKGTEKPFSSPLLNLNSNGSYLCIGCGAELFPSQTKFNSGCGWPSFHTPSNGENSINRFEDRSHGMVRVEVTCKSCNAHLGHVFKEPTPSGERFCINGVALKFQPK